MNIICVV